MEPLIKKFSIGPVTGSVSFHWPETKTDAMIEDLGLVTGPILNLMINDNYLDLMLFQRLICTKKTRSAPPEISQYDMTNIDSVISVANTAKARPVLLQISIDYVISVLTGKKTLQILAVLY